MSDLDFMAGATPQAGQPAGETEDALLQNPYEGQESQYSAGIEALPRFNKYHGSIDDARGQKSKNKGTSGLRFALKIVNGPKGSVGKKAFVDLWLAPKKFEKVKDPNTGEMVTVELKGDKKAEAEKEFHLDLNRVATRLGLKTLRPKANTEEALTEWIAPAVGKNIIFALGVDKSEEYGDRNKIPSLKTIAAPGDKVVDDNGQPTGKTMLDAALEAIKKYDENAGKKAGKGVGTTAGGFANPTAPGGMFGGAGK